MAFEQRSLDDYVDVSQRIADFRAQYPEGSLRPWNPAEPWRIVQAEGWDKGGEHIMQSFVVAVAAAYRHPLDESPGVGMAWEVFPGRTPYTRGSELQNAETSAWGRAIIAVGASDSKRGIASREEVRNRQAERDDGLPQNRDGSLSRSRTTDEQKDAAGVMTSAQHAEHTQLAKPPASGRTTERLTTTPEDDPWLLTGTRPGGGTPASESAMFPRPASAAGDGTSPAGNGSGTTPAPGVPGTPAEDRAGTSSAAQIREMHALFGQLGVTDRGARLNLTRSVLGLDMLASSKQLSYRQAGDLLLALRDQAKARTDA